MIKIGDKVRFLDSKGGGIVRRFSGKDLVMVEDEDGFEIPTLASQCVVVNDRDDDRAAGRVHAAEPKEVEQPSVPRYDDLKSLQKPVRTPERKEGDVLNLYLAFLPADGRRLSESKFYVYLVNDSNFWVFATLLQVPDGDAERSAKEREADARSVCRYAGIVEPNTKIQLFSIEGNKLDALEHCAVQLVAFKRDRAFTTQSPMHVEVNLNVNRFLKLHSFVENDFFEQEALLQPIVRDGRPYLPMKLDEEVISRGIREKVQAQRAQHRPQPRPVVQKDGAIEVDLHIGALLDTTAGMDNAAMLQYQLETFRRTMESYRHLRGQKIVFIHGKGEGVLRKAILDELKAHYAACQWQDASFRQYGFGATLVTIQGKL
jgi:hypothetical protein